MGVIAVETQAVDNGGAVAILRLNVPDRRNTIGLDTVSAIIEAFAEFESETSNVGAVVITGTGRAFCAGADLSQLSAHGEADAADREAGLRQIYEGFLRIARSSLPTVAAVNGPAVGAGLNLALCCDVRIAGRSARFDPRFMQLGLHPGGGHMWMLQRTVGPQVAAAMVLFSEALNAEEALRHGLVLDVVEDEALAAQAVEFAARAASAPRALIQRAKRELMMPPDEHARAVDREIEAQVWSMEQPFFAERLAQLRQRMAQKG